MFSDCYYSRVISRVVQLFKHLVHTGPRTLWHCLAFREMGELRDGKTGRVQGIQESQKNNGHHFAWNWCADTPSAPLNAIMIVLEAPKRFWKCLQTSRLHLWSNVDLFLIPLYAAGRALFALLHT